MCIKIVIPFIPMSKKNSKRILKRKDGTRFIASQKGYNEQEVLISLIFKSKINRMLVAPVSVKATFEYKNMRRRDMSNSFETVLDALVRSGVIEDDSWKFISKTIQIAKLSDNKEEKTIIEIDEIKNFYDMGNNGK